ncbi:MAG: hypothetical protein ABJB85_08190 [Nitrososphaerota archaeon]
MTYAWEWASWRFNNGARGNMYNFDGHQVGTYQNAEGSTQWFDNFIVKQNGYAKHRMACGFRGVGVMVFP